MPQSTDLSVSPYFDDTLTTANAADYHAVLFKPTSPVQTRELNGLQAILRRQVEKFGDTVYRSGTVIDGCSLVFHDSYPYAKIRDLTADGFGALPGEYVGLVGTGAVANVRALVVNWADGFESTTPDLKTVYLRYTNAGADGNTHSFAPGEVVTLADPSFPVASVNVASSGVGFANSDTVQFTSALAVNVSTGTFTNGSYVTVSATGANLQVVGVDSTTLAAQGQVILRVAPRDADLANATLTSDAWAVANNTPIRNAANTAAGTVLSVVGAGASAALVTDAAGRVDVVSVLAGGAGYTTPPSVRIRSPGNLTGLAGLSLVAQTFAARVTVANTVDAVGEGYAVSVDSGTIYQKGLFLRVAPQTVVVDRYDVTPNAVAVGFTTIEAVVDSDLDPSLLDNSAGFGNDTAPGADRLRFTPTLVATEWPPGDPSLLAVAAFSEGLPYLQNKTSAYSSLGDEMDRRTYEAEGDFVLARFGVTTRSVINAASEAAKMSVVVSPGTAYVHGHRVQTTRNAVMDVDKGIDSSTVAAVSMTLSYDNWLPVREVGGVFQFSTGDVVALYDTAKTFISGTGASSGNATPTGNVVGAARVRSMTLQSGVPGTSAAVYRLYLFDVKPAAGRSLADARSVAYGANAGIADVVTVVDSFGSTIAAMGNTLYDSLLFRTPVPAVKSVANLTYSYRTIDQTLTMANTGVVTRTLTDPASVYSYPVGALSSTALADLYLVPTSADLIASANLAGTVAVNATSRVLTGTGTSLVTDVMPGDWVQVFSNSTVNELRQVASVTNSTAATLATNSAFTAVACALYRAFPRLVPVPLGPRAGLVGNVSSNGSLLTLSTGFALQAGATVALAVDATRTAAPGAKQADRQRLLKLSLANNAGGTVGPWCVGVSDALRLRGVWLGTNSSVNTSSTDVTSAFYLDHNQNEDYLDLGYLFQVPGTTVAVTNASWLLVSLDALTTTSGGYFVASSYLNPNTTAQFAIDSTPLSGLGANVAALEVPEVYTARGDYYDLQGCVDFRPIAANSAVLTTNAATAPVNPAYVLSFGNTASPANDKRFPVPDSTLVGDFTAWMGRVDSVCVGHDGEVIVVRGSPGLSTARMRQARVPASAMRVAVVKVPPYPTVPRAMSALAAAVADTSMACERLSTTRVRQRVAAEGGSTWASQNRQPTRYAQRDIAAIDRRVASLEYYAGVSQLEAELAGQVVPSSVDPTVNRSKFGIQADDFSTQTLQDVSNPAYAASVARGQLMPKTISWYVRHGVGPVLAAPWVDFLVASQGVATGDAPPSVASSNGWLLRIDHDAAQEPDPSTGFQGFVQLTDGQAVTLGSNAGPVSFFFHVPPTASVVSGIIDPDQFVIYQGHVAADFVPILFATSAAVPLTAADKTRLQSNAVPAAWFQSTTFAPLSGVGGDFVSGSGKIQWTHDPTRGRSYTIISTRQGMFDHWRWALEYPRDPAPALVPITVGGVLTYSGVLAAQPATLVRMFAGEIGEPAGIILDDPNAPGEAGYLDGYISNISGGFIFDHGRNRTDHSELQNYNVIGPVDTTLLDQAFRLEARGLKPSTAHGLRVGGVLQQAQCRIVGGAMGDPLVSDARGNLSLDWFWNPATSAVPVGQTSVGVTTSVFETITYNYQPVTDGTLSLVLADAAGVSSAVLQLAVVRDTAVGYDVPSAVAYFTGLIAAQDY